ncbi:MAG TPA: hypothetical protein VK037_01400 [Pseudogracilibacillus sp.]|nr:hypothetical protein [Pseudogracilibacillus sp.]
MTKVTVDQFVLSDDYIQRLLQELRKEKVRNREDLQRYLRKYTYMDDPGRKCHLLISPSEKQPSFALPYDEE